MNILPQIHTEIQTAVITQLNEHMQVLLSSVTFDRNIQNYTHLIQNLDDYLQNYALQLMKKTFEDMDKEFRNAPDRTQRYYVKSTRNRTLMTLYGELTFKRTQYVDRLDNKSFCYVDEKLGLKKRERFDCCIKTLVIEAYADHNSMIKVGKMVGDKVAGKFSNHPENYWISRQTVYNILHRFKSIQTDTVPSEITPEVLYIMADEKYIPLQGQLDNEPNKQMVKVAVIFEGSQAVIRKDGTKTQRKELVNKTIVSTCESQIWDQVYDTITQKYDIRKVKQIYLMGDGASWIKNGVSALSSPEYKVTFCIDEFHFKQAICKITKDPLYLNVLFNYAYKDMKKDFNYVIQMILDDNPLKKDIIIVNRDYLNRNWSAFKTIIHHAKMGCAMEQAISHIIASVFTSVPKAYSKKNLPTYLNYRTLHQNKSNLRNLLIKAMVISSSQNEVVHICDYDYDFSFFNPKPRQDRSYFINNIYYHI